MAELSVTGDVDKVVLGADTIWQNSDGWVPLKPPAGINGTVLFRDNLNGTASLLGSIGFAKSLTPTDGSFIFTTLLLSPPKGYEFLDTPWSVGSKAPSMYALRGVKSDESAINSDMATISFKNGSLYLENLVTYFQLNGNERVVINFDKNSTVKASSTKVEEMGDPAIINIKKV